mgnify:CR=1 FL=1
MPDNKPEIKGPPPARAGEQRVLARKRSSRRNRRLLIVIMAAIVFAGVVCCLPWGRWNLPALPRHPAGLLGSRPPPPAPAFVPFLTAGFDGEAALQETRDFVNLGPRPAGASGARKAAEHLASRLGQAGVSVAIDEFTDSTPEGVITFRNIVGTLGNTAGPFVILASHYDTKTGLGDAFIGANDSGSSSGLLIEMARFLRAQPGPVRGVMFAFLDGEECLRSYSDRDGLHGSRRLARQLVSGGQASNVLGVVLLDMVGDKDLSVTLPNNGSSELVSMALTSAREENARLKFSLMGRPLLDDHEPFLAAGMRAVDIVDFCYGSGPGRNDYWHTTQDTLDKLSAESLGIVGRVAIRVVNKLLGQAPGRSSP